MFMENISKVKIMSDEKSVLKFSAHINESYKKIEQKLQVPSSTAPYTEPPKRHY